MHSTYAKQFILEYSNSFFIFFSLSHFYDSELCVFQLVSCLLHIYTTSRWTRESFARWFKVRTLQQRAGEAEKQLVESSSLLCIHKAERCWASEAVWICNKSSNWFAFVRTSSLSLWIVKLLSPSTTIDTQIDLWSWNKLCKRECLHAAIAATACERLLSVDTVCNFKHNCAAWVCCTYVN